MSLNDYRDEAGDFIKSIGAEYEGLEQKVKMLEEEFDILKSSTSEPDKFNHRVYDMLFILFEMASETNFDIDTEWERGRIRKQEKYHLTI